jgi:sortase A
MPLAVYVKKNHRHLSVKKLTMRFLSYVSMTIGFGLLFWSVYPILSYELSQRLWGTRVLLSPSRSSITSSHVLGAQTNMSQNIREFIRVADWFPTRPQGVGLNAATIPYPTYQLSIPKLSLVDLKVTVGGEDLERSIVHYLPTTAPGDYGTVNLFGHSTLPQLFNQKDYKTIFTYLPKLTIGDTLVINAGGQRYEYEVYDMVVVKPEQVSVLEPRYDAAYLTLITCVPPGTYWNRLVVRSKLKHLPIRPAQTQ